MMYYVQNDHGMLEDDAFREEVVSWAIVPGKVCPWLSLGWTQFNGLTASLMPWNHQFFAGEALVLILKLVHKQQLRDTYHKA